MPFLANLKHRGLVSMTGRDTFKYLQALTTNNLSNPSSQFSSFLNAQGRILYDAFIYRTGESDCYLEVDLSQMEDFMAHLKRYKLRSKIVMRRLADDELQVYSVFNSSSAQSEISIPAELVHQSDQRAPKFGSRVLSPDSSALASLQLPESSVSTYTQARFLNAIAEGPEEMIPEKALPQESNIDHMHGLEYRKGCYLGQELTVRTYHTGVVRKRIVPVRLFPTSGEPPETVSAGLGNVSDDENKWVPTERCEITSQNDSGVKKRSSGRVLAAIGNVGIALCRLENMQQGTIEKDGQQVGVRPYLPAHWPR